MARMWAVWLVSSGCVIDGDGWWNDAPVDDQVWLEPNVVKPGATTVLTIDDDPGEFDRYDVYDVRSLGEYAITEWSQQDGRVAVVVTLDPAPQQDEQVMAIDLTWGTAYATFYVE